MKAFDVTLFLFLFVAVLVSIVYHYLDEVREEDKQRQANNHVEEKKQQQPTTTNTTIRSQQTLRSIHHNDLFLTNYILTNNKDNDSSIYNTAKNREDNKQPNNIFPRSSSSSTVSFSSSTDSTTLSSRTELLNTFRMCRISPAPQLGQPPVAMERMEEHEIRLGYQCAGFAYEEFATHLEELILKEHNERSFVCSSNDEKNAMGPQKEENCTSLWGRRVHILPPPPKQPPNSLSSPSLSLPPSANTSNSSPSVLLEKGFENDRVILFLGNSHTRQVLYSLLCQYQNDIMSSTDVRRNKRKKARVENKIRNNNNGSSATEENTTINTTATTSESVSLELNDNTTTFPMPPPGRTKIFHMTENVTIYSVINIPHVYSKNWQSHLETILERPLSSFDLIVLGHFNELFESRQTSFEMEVKRYMRNYPELGIDFETIDPPVLTDLGRVYHQGTILSVGNFDIFHSMTTTAISSLPSSQPVVAERETKTTKRQGNSQHHSSITDDDIEMRNNTAQIRSIDSRAYISKLQQRVLQFAAATQKEENSNTAVRKNKNSTLFYRSALYEGRTHNGKSTVSTCEHEDRSSGGHRCIGSRGGHPDLIAWDIIELFHEIFKEPH